MEGMGGTGKDAGEDGREGGKEGPERGRGARTGRQGLGGGRDKGAFQGRSCGCRDGGTAGMGACGGDSAAWQKQGGVAGIGEGGTDGRECMGRGGSDKCRGTEEGRAPAVTASKADPWAQTAA